MDALHFRTFEPVEGEPEQRCLIVHGIMGSSQNWLGATRKLRALYPRWSFTLVDLPGHGDSSSSVSAPNLPAIARAIHTQLQADGWIPTMVVGHSFGGKTVMTLAQLYPRSALSIWLLDAPIDADVAITGVDTIHTILDVVESIPQPNSRSEVLATFSTAGLTASIAEWMTTNVRRTQQGFEWKIDPIFVRAALKDYLSRAYWSQLETPPAEHTFYLVLAGRGNWWRGNVERKLRKLTHARIFTLPRAGHWVHIDDLDGLIHCFQRIY